MRNFFVLALPLALLIAPAAHAWTNADDSADIVNECSEVHDTGYDVKCPVKTIVLTPASFNCVTDFVAGPGAQSTLALTEPVDGQTLQFNSLLTCADTIAQLIQLQNATSHKNVRLAIADSTYTEQLGTEYPDGTLASAVCRGMSTRYVNAIFANLDTRPFMPDDGLNEDLSADVIYTDHDTPGACR